MRISWIATVPVLAGLIAVPAQGQASARIHVDIPIGHGAVIGNAGQRRPLMVREYDQGRFGGWEGYYDQWIPVTVYLYDGYYYDYPIVPYAEPIVVYRFRDELFFAPRQREFVTWREQYRVQPYRREIDRNYRPMQRDDRNDRRIQAPRDGRDARGQQGGARQVQPQRDDRGQQGGRQAQPPRNDRGQQGGRPAAPPSRGNGGGARPRPGGH